MRRTDIGILVRHQWLDAIGGTVHGVMVFVAHCLELTAYAHRDVFRCGERGEVVLQAVDNLAEEDEGCLRIGLLSRTVGEEDHILEFLDLTEGLVLLHDELVVFLLEPVAPAVVELGEKLGIELAVVDAAGVVDGWGIDAEEPTRTRGIDERASVVSGGDEGSKTVALLEELAIGRPHLHVVLGDEVFQERLLTALHDIELIDIDEGVGGHSEVDVGVVLHRDAIVVVRLEVFGKETATEGGLAGTLRTDEDGDDGIAVLAVLARPLGNHREHPHVELSRPVWVGGLHATGKFLDTVAAVPGWKVVEEVGQGVVLRNEGAVEVSVEIFVPRLHSCL